MHSDIIIRINKVIDYIEQHLSGQHQLEELAKIASLSKFHFLRTFKIITQETPVEYINRKRIERIASLLTLNPGKKLSDLSYQYGFENLSSFSRCFKKYFGVSASQYINENRPSFLSKNSNIGKTSTLTEQYLCTVKLYNEWTNNNADIQVKNLPEKKVAYVRHWGNPHTIYKSFDNLIRLCEMEKNEIARNKFLILFHDNPSLTVESKIQLSACMEIKEKAKFNEKTPDLIISSQKYLVGNFELKNNEYEMAWNSMVIWMNENKLSSKNGYRFEQFSYKNLMKTSGTKQIEIAIPIN